MTEKCRRSRSATVQSRRRQYCRRRGRSPAQHRSQSRNAGFVIDGACFRLVAVRIYPPVGIYHQSFYYFSSGCRRIYIAGKLLRGLFHQLLLFKFWQRTFRISRRTLVKTEFWFGLLLTPALALVCLLTLLAVWGVSVDIMLNNVKNFLVGFDIGGIRISITSILLGIICFFISLSLFKMLKTVLPPET